MSLPTANIIDIGDDRMLGLCPDGRKIWLDGPAVPGDEVEFEDHGKTGEIIRISTPASDRISAPCPHFEVCPGCLLQPLPYERQVALKEAKIVETLRRLGGFDGFDFAGVCPSSDPYGTRNKLDFTVRGGELGYRIRKGLSPVETCPVGRPVLRDLILPLREWLRAHPGHDLHRAMLRTGSDHRSVHLLFRGGLSPAEERDLLAWTEARPEIESVSIQADWKQPWRRLQGSGALCFDLAGESHTVPHDAFFQVHDELADTLVRATLERAREARPASLLDLFCGSGAFTLPAARFCDTVLGLDSRPGKGPFQKADLRRGLPNKVMNTPWDLVLVDPPRAGMEKRLVQQLRDRVRPRRLLYVSCNPATLARDLQRLCAKGDYTLNWVRGFDLFPQTSHVETLCEVVRV